MLDTPGRLDSAVLDTPWSFDSLHWLWIHSGVTVNLNKATQFCIQHYGVLILLFWLRFDVHVETL
jgi:hypothetical protein